MTPPPPRNWGVFLKSSYSILGDDQESFSVAVLSRSRVLAGRRAAIEAISFGF